MFPSRWFVALPDTEGSVGISQALHELCVGRGRLSEVRHPSGRPWLIGCWDPRRLALGRSRDGVIAVLGEHSVSDDWLTTRTAAASSVADLDAVTSGIRGSAHLVASIGGRVRVQGTASGSRRIYRCVADGVPVVSDRAGMLARLIQAAPDRARLAVRLLSNAPWPLAWESVWSGVEAVLPGHYVLLPGDAPAREVRWWSPPEPELDGKQSAELLCTALTDAVAARVRPGERVVTDLSGLDSSTVCSLAVRAGAEVVALTGAQPDALDEDVAWARRTVAGLRERGYDLRHDVIPAMETPLVFEGVLDSCGDFDEPFGNLHNQARFRFMLQRGAGHRSRMHLTGIGGDELFVKSYPWLLSLTRRSPLSGFGQARAIAGHKKWPLGAFGRALLRHRTHPTWLRAMADALGGPAADPRAPRSRWGTAPVLPAWASAEALDLVREALHSAADTYRPLAEDQGMHVLLATVHAGAREMLCFRQIGELERVGVSAPFLDDTVMHAALSVRPIERNESGRYKPLLVEAMRGIVPDTTLTRVSKSSTTMTFVLGSRAHRDQILGLAEDSHLARAGLVDPTRLREACHRPIDVRTPNQRIERTISCEMWLRNESENDGVHLGV